MKLKASKLFSQSDLNRISAAVKEAERRTSGEIVPYVVDRSDSYTEAEWRGGVLAGTATLVAFMVQQESSHSWMQPGLAQVIIVSMVAFLAGALAVRYVPFCKRLLVGRAAMDRRVHQKAAEAFVAEEVFDTRERTGVLIFLSLFEHKVVVIGDSGINAKVKHSDWEGIVQLIVAGIQSRKAADGLISAIGQCGDLLERAGVAIRKNDADELSDNLRLSDSPDR